MIKWFLEFMGPWPMTIIIVSLILLRGWLAYVYSWPEEDDE